MQESEMPQTVSSIQFLRFVAALLVVVFHANQVVTKTFHWQAPDFLSNLVSIGPAGVHIFFVISGFIMFYTSHEKFGNFANAKIFLLRRLIRILPIYWIYSLFYYSFHSLYLNGYDLSASELIASAFLMPEYASLVIGPGWTLSYEMFFYIAFASVMVFSSRMGLLLITFAFVALAALGFALKLEHPIGHVVTNSLLLEFLFGAWIAFFVLRGASIERKLAQWILILSICGFSVGVVIGYERLPSVVMWGIPSALLVAGLALQERNGDTPALIRRFSCLGDSSYSLYLLHILILDVSILLIRKLFFEYHLNEIALILGLSFVCFSVSFLLYSLIEKRVLSSLKGLLTLQRASAVSEARTNTR